MELLAHTEILKHTLPALSRGEAEEVIRKLEAGLANGAEWCYDRIQFLGQSDPYAWGETADCSAAGVYCITVSKMRRIAREGLVQVWRDGLISAIEIGAFADDIASLRQFNRVLLEEVAEGHLAPVWEHFWDSPPNLPPSQADLERIYLGAKKKQEKLEEKERQEKKGSR